MNTKNYLTPTKKYRILASSIHNVYRLINSTFELNDLIIRLTKLLYQIFNAEYSQVLLTDLSKKYSLLKCTAANGKKYTVDKSKRALSGMAKRIARTAASIQKERILGLPLISEDVVGVVILKRAESAACFEDFDQELLITIIEQAIIGIKNFQLYDEQQKIVLGSIKSLVTLLDSRIPQEYAHSSYFSRLVTSIGHQMHLDEKQIESLKYASLLHDAGKIDIPSEILKKTSKLTAREYRIVKLHPLRGAQILRPLQMLKPAIPIILHHHEKYNGTGYPSRLKKDQIPQGARIMAVADAFEAMVYGRPYRERMDINSAIKEIKRKSGIQFDPKVVDAFLRAIKKIDRKKYLSR